MAKHNHCQGATSVRGTYLTIELRVHARMDRLPPSSFTYAINCLKDCKMTIDP
jgi:hypothetical protein